MICKGMLKVCTRTQIKHMLARFTECLKLRLGVYTPYAHEKQDLILKYKHSH